MNKLLTYVSIFLFTSLLMISCDKEEAIVSEDTTLSEQELNFKKAGGSQVIVLKTNAKTWSANIPSEASWIKLDRNSGSTGNSFLSVSIDKNPTGTIRTASFTVSTNLGASLQVSVSQSGSNFPSYNLAPIAAEKAGMESTAEQLAAKMTFGWNAGNTMEAIGGETAWGNPEISLETIKLVKSSGFNAIRIPCSWDQYADKNTAQISATWLNRVKKVVQMCVDNDVYVLLNIHWDGGWLENNVNTEKQSDVAEKQKAYWEQIATHLREFDEHLLFASANEPNVENQAQMDVLSSYHQVFVDAVRATGGRNAHRVLVIQGPSTDIDKTDKLMNTLPTDKVPNKLMAEVHFYTPWNFCGLEKDESWGNQFFYWGKDNHSTTDPGRNPTWGEEATVDELFAKLAKKFAGKNIPVIVGEFNAHRRLNLKGADLALHLKSRNYYLNYVTKKCLEHKFIPFYWDTGVYENGSGIFDRRIHKITDQEALKALIIK